MKELLYNPESCGREVVSSRGKKVKIRKYHMTDFEMTRNRGRWEDDIKDVSTETKSKAGNLFFNPYRKGIYHYQIKTLFLLGSNEWHSLNVIVSKLSEIMLLEKMVKNGINMNAWELFRDRSYQKNPAKSKDYLGKIQENFLFFQRLSQLHPYGYKLMQVSSSVDIKRVSSSGFTHGLFYYRLSTYNSPEESIPIRDFSEFIFHSHKNRYINYKFIGKIITNDFKTAQD